MEAYDFDAGAAVLFLNPEGPLAPRAQQACHSVRAPRRHQLRDRSSLRHPRKRPSRCSLRRPRRVLLILLTRAGSIDSAQRAFAVVSSRELDEQVGSVGASGCSDRISNGTDEAGDGPGGDRSCDRGRCALWLCAGGCGLWDERAVPPGAHSSRTCLGGRYSAAPQGVPCRCADDLAGCWARPCPAAARPRCSIDSGRRHAGRRHMAEHQLAHRYERKAQGAVCAVSGRASSPPRAFASARASPRSVL